MRFIPYLTLAVASCASTIALAGPLSPPVGPVASTSKPLSEIEPRIAINATNTPGDADSLFRITQPGSYYLTANVVGVANKHGIEIASSGVSIDLNGFNVSGTASVTNVSGVIVTQSGLSAIEVRNGTVRGWRSFGIDLGTFNASICTVRNIRTTVNFAGGMSVGEATTITGCVASNNTGDGILASRGNTITNCSAFFNGGTGIFLSIGSTVSSSSASQNGGTGISTQSGCTVTNCNASDNTADGILVSTGSTVSNSTAYSNNGAGISAFSGSTVTDCTASENSGTGIEVLTGCTVKQCVVRANAFNGIRATSQGTILFNTCAINGNGGDGAGIHITGSDCRIEGNNCVGADRGIDIDGAGNFVIKNTCSSNTLNWDIVINNYYGPIVDRSTVLTGVASGNSAPSQLQTTDPNANFTF